jgi:ankyrin repeat protein
MESEESKAHGLPPTSKRDSRNGKTRTMRSDKNREMTTYGRSITQLMKLATNADTTLLIEALSNEEIAKTLFYRDEKGRTALDWARLTRNYQAITILISVMSTAINNARLSHISKIDKVENLIIQTNEEKGKALREAIKTRQSTLALNLLLENQIAREEVETLGRTFFVDQPTDIGYSPLILAAGMNMNEVVRELINLKTPINHENKFGQTALTVAANAGNADIVYFLLFSGANVYQRTNDGRTALHYACMFAKAKVVKVVFDHILERFGFYRNEAHSLTEFDYTRWANYIQQFQELLDVSLPSAFIHTSICSSFFV